MLKELQDKIIAACPNVVFSLPQWWGFECGNGWFDLVHDLFAELNDLPYIGDVRFTCVKTKFAELRVYFYFTEGSRCEGVSELIQKATDRARNTCEACGKPGCAVVDSRGWLRVTCLIHRKPDDRNRYEGDMGVSTLWFGPSWGAPICLPANECETPNRPCYLCSKEFVSEDRGLVMPFHGGPGDPASLPAHLECLSVALGFPIPKTV